MNRFQHTAARRRLVALAATACSDGCFNTQPPEGGWARISLLAVKDGWFQHTAARRRLGFWRRFCWFFGRFQHPAARRRLGLCDGKSDLYSCFNTQPPEGGWERPRRVAEGNPVFQHTAARRRLGWCFVACRLCIDVSTHSRPKAAGCSTVSSIIGIDLFQHTAARRRLEGRLKIPARRQVFQHTAARRRLGRLMCIFSPKA